LPLASVKGVVSQTQSDLAHKRLSETYREEENLVLNMSLVAKPAFTRKSDDLTKKKEHLRQKFDYYFRIFEQPK